MYYLITIRIFVKLNSFIKSGFYQFTIHLTCSYGNWIKKSTNSKFIRTHCQGSHGSEGVEVTKTLQASSQKSYFNYPKLKMLYVYPHLYIYLFFVLFQGATELYYPKRTLIDHVLLTTKKLFSNPTINYKEFLQ